MDPDPLNIYLLNPLEILGSDGGWQVICSVGSAMTYSAAACRLSFRVYAKHPLIPFINLSLHQTVYSHTVPELSTSQKLHFVVFFTSSHIVSKDWTPFCLLPIFLAVSTLTVATMHNLPNFENSAT